MKKATISSLLIFILFIFLYSTQASAGLDVPHGGTIESGSYEEIQWVLYTDGTLIISGKGALPDLTQPWIEYRNQITGVIIESGISRIGEGAFAFCPVTEIRVASTVESIGENAFESCNVLHDVFFDGTKEQWNAIDIDGYAEDGSNANLYDATKHHALLASGICNDDVIWTLDASGTLVISGQGTIYNHNSNYYDAPWTEYSENIHKVVVSEGITEIDGVFTWCKQLKNVVLPDSITKMDNTFAYCINLNSARIPNGIKNISNTFFKCWNLQEVYLPETLERISDLAFYKCRQLKRILLPEGLRSIESSAFCDTGLTEVTIPHEVESIGSDSFALNNYLQNIYLLGDLPAIADNAFRGVTATVYYPENNNTYTAASMKNYGGNLTWKPWTIADLASGGCGDGLTWSLNSEGKLEISGSGEIDDYSNGQTAPWQNYGEQIKTVNIVGGVTRIGDNAFQGLTGIKTVFIPSSVSSIGNMAFQGCGGLSGITVYGDAPEISEDGFCGVSATIYYPSNNDTYTDEFRQNYGGILVWEPDYYTVSAGSCIYDLDDDVSFELNSGGTLVIYGIGVAWNDYGWNDYGEFKTVIIMNGVTGIGESLFAGCESLVTVTIPESLISVGDHAFDGCIALTEINVPCSSYAEVWAKNNSLNYNLTHDWGETNYIWSEDCSKLTASRTCARNYTHVERETVNVACEVTRSPTENTTGTYNLSSEGFLNTAFEKQERIDVEIPALGNMSVLRLPTGIREVEEDAFEGIACQAVIIPEGCSKIRENAFANCEELTVVPCKKF